MQSGRAPWWRRVLHTYAPFLFKQCPDKDGEELGYGNYHWCWDSGCQCFGRRGPVRGWK